MQQNLNCPTCGTSIPADSTDGLCPRCLLAGATDASRAAGREDETLDSSASLSVDQVIDTGDRFGEYELLEEIARGGMGVVFKARHRQLGRVVALKMILSGNLASDQDVERFRREAEAAATLDHSGIVPIYEIGQQGDQHFFAMKLVEGGALSGQMDELRKDTRAIVGQLEKVARAVHYAHQRGILHRDLKPANILLDESGEPLITDLGLAKQIESNSDLTQSGAIVGTPAYMPPEQASAEKGITTAADIYSIGAILYEALTGRPPHIGDSPIATLLKVIGDDVVAPREIDRKIDRSLDLICMKCLRRDPNARYSSAAALADDLDRWIEGKSVSVRPPSLGSTVTEMLRSNLRSAIGAGMIGIAAGVLFAFCLSKLNSRGYVAGNPPTSIYEALPAEIPLGRSVFFQNETDVPKEWLLTAILGSLSSMGLVGAAVARLTRAKPGSEALAYGLVAGLMMSIAMFNLHLGSGTVGQARSHLKALGMLSHAAIGTSDQQAEANKMLLESYPGLAEIRTDDRARVLTFRVFYDDFYQGPIGTIWGMVMTAVLCLVPCIFGTLFASQLMAEPNSVRWSVLAYSEFAVVMLLLIVSVFFGLLVPLADRTASLPPTLSGWKWHIVVYTFLISWAALSYRRVHWYVRVPFYLTMVLGVAYLMK